MQVYHPCTHVKRTEIGVECPFHCSSPYILRQDLSPNLERPNSGRLAGQRGPRIHLSLPLSAEVRGTDFKWLLGA